VVGESETAREALRTHWWKRPQTVQAIELPRILKGIPLELRRSSEATRPESLVRLGAWWDGVGLKSDGQRARYLVPQGMA
jgi:hypothetical protein